MKKLLLSFLISIPLSTFSQFKITGYFDAELGINYVLSDKFQAELRINDNTEIEFNTELSLLYKFVAKENYNLNFGVGVSTFPFGSNNVDFFESIFLPLQIEINPFKEAKNFGLVLETAYHFSDITDTSGIRNSIGLRYSFK